MSFIYKITARGSQGGTTLSYSAYTESEAKKVVNFLRSLTVGYFNEEDSLDIKINIEVTDINETIEEVETLPFDDI